MKKRGVKQIVIDGHKGCSRCLEIKPISEFCKNSRVQSGLHSYCNSCKTILYLELKSRKLNGENFVTEKKCKICDEVKPRESFTVCASTDGLFPYCKTCYNKISNKRYYDGLLNPSSREVRNRAYRKKYNSDESFRLKQSISKRIWYELRRKNDSKNWTRVEEFLKYKVSELFEVIGPRPSNDYHLDHKIPYSWFTDDCPFDISFSIDNLWWVTKEYNFRKLNHWCDEVPEEYLNKVIPFLNRELVYENK
jgi:hypothetical protein